MSSYQLKYTHPEWGITITYPSSWTLSVPDFDKLAQPPAEGVPEGYTYNPNIEQMRMLGHVITLHAADENGLIADGVTIALETYTISPGTKLQTWVDLVHQLGALENPLASSTKITSLDVAQLPFAEVGDQVVYDVLKNETVHIQTIWIAKGELVFSIAVYSTDPQVLAQVHQIAATIEFDVDQIAEIRAKAPFAGDEQQMKAAIDHLQPQPTPTCDLTCQDQKVTTR